MVRSMGVFSTGFSAGSSSPGTDQFQALLALDLAEDAVKITGRGHDRQLDVERLRHVRAPAQGEFHLHRDRAAPGLAGVAALDQTARQRILRD